jgi:hypothetical protein
MMYSSRAARRPVHAYLLVGPRLGVEEAALLRSPLHHHRRRQALVGPLLRGVHPDVFVIDPGPQIRVEMRNVVEEVSRSPSKVAP